MMGVIVYAEKADDVAITGPGRIDGNGMAYVTATGPNIYTCTNIRPFSVVLKDCRHVLLREFSLTNSAFWTLRLLGLRRRLDRRAPDRRGPADAEQRRHRHRLVV